MDKIVFIVLALVGGLIMFLYGMDLMGDSLKKLAGGKLESILAKLTSNRFKGLLLGFFVTAIIQSSSATTVMLVGFVNSGIMQLGQTIGVILGANVGTTVTAWLLSTAEIDGAAFVIKLFKPESFTPLLAAIGFIINALTKDDRKKNTGNILIGFAILMFGMEAMSGAVEGLRDNEKFIGFLTMFDNPILGVIAGTIFTAVIQSSSASIGVLQALAITGVIPFSTAVPLILGMNIGTTITPVISALSGNIDSKRVAVLCVYIKAIDVIVIASGFYLLHMFVGFEFMVEDATAIGIAVLHTGFNVLSTVIMLPFTGAIEKLVLLTIKSKKVDKEIDRFATLDERFLEMPSFAVEKCRDLVCEMADISHVAFLKATALLDSFDAQNFAEVERLEALVDKYEDKTSTYLIKIAEHNMSSRDSKVVTELLHCIGDIERISDHALNIAEVAKEIHDKKIDFSDKAKVDIRIINNAVSEILSLAVQALNLEDMEIAAKVEPLEQVIDNINRKIKSGHVSRLKHGDCTIELGFILSDLLTNYERISDHCSNIAVCFIEISHDSFETHQYLSNVKSGDDNEFKKLYESYEIKYAID